MDDRPIRYARSGAGGSWETPVGLHRVTTLICGCMFSGKTTALLRRLAACDPASALAVKPLVDQRYSANEIVSHDGQAMAAVAVASAGEILDWLTTESRFVAIDEAHFFDESLNDVLAVLRDLGLDVMLTSLDLDSWGRPFPAIECLRGAADETALLFATCARCGRRADHTQRMTPIVDGNLVGGPESYEPRCLACWRPPPENPPDGSAVVRRGR